MLESTDVPLGSFPSAVSNKWHAYPDGWRDTTGHGRYYPSKVLSVHNGLLDYYIHTENGVHMVAAPLPKIQAGPKDYGSGLPAGRYAVRFRSDPLTCYKTAWLLWPDSTNWPNDGEIDFPEGDLNDTIKAFMHRQNATVGEDQDAYSTNTTYANWHTAVTEWRPDQSNLKFYLDGRLIGESTSRVPNTPMHWVLQTETTLRGCTPANSTQGHVYMDWVAAWKPAPPTPTPTPTPSAAPLLNITPSVTIKELATGDTIKAGSTIRVKVEATDLVGISKVELFINDENRFTDTDGKYTFEWQVPSRTGVEYTIRAKATNTLGNVKNAQVVVKSR